MVVPVHRNARTLDELHSRLSAALSTEADARMVFVDDSCPEGSAEVLSRLQGVDPRVAVVRHATNMGQHRAVLTGLGVARGWTVIMDADLQDPPEAVPLLLERARGGGVEVVFGGRRGRYQGAARTMTGRAYRRVLASLTGLPADAGMFCAINEDVARRLVALRGPSPSVVAMIAATRPRVTSIPVVRARRRDDASAYTVTARVRSAWRAFRWVAWARRTRAPEAT